MDGFPPLDTEEPCRPRPNHSQSPKVTFTKTNSLPLPVSKSHLTPAELAAVNDIQSIMSRVIRTTFLAHDFQDPLNLLNLTILCGFPILVPSRQAASTAEVLGSASASRNPNLFQNIFRSLDTWTLQDVLDEGQRLFIDPHKYDNFANWDLPPKS